MDAEEALALLDTVLQGQKLRDVQEQIFRYTWQGWTYPEIANQLGYDTGHIRDVGAQLWQRIAQATGEKVSKNNVQAVLRRQVFQRQSVTDSFASLVSTTDQLPNQPKGLTVAVSSEQPKRLAESQQQQRGEAPEAPVFLERESELATLEHQHHDQKMQQDRHGRDTLQQFDRRCQLLAPAAATEPELAAINLQKATHSDDLYNTADDVKQGVRRPSQTLEVDSLVQFVRKKIYHNIQTCCGTLRVLDMSQPIELEAIYITVNLLESIQGRQRRTLADLLEEWNIENLYDSSQTEEQISGLTAVEQYSKLIIFGKPGAGKTTFLKWLGIQCNNSKLWADLVPVFVSLKAFAEAKGQPELLTYIQKHWANCGVLNTQAAETLLQQGRVLILLDGLDEVRETDYDYILQEVREFSTRFHTCRLIITCRVAAQEYTFEQFTEVEIADFDNQQICDFVTKWFEAKADSVKAKYFIQKLQDNQRIQELATNALLLTLLCSVFEEFAASSANRTKLYQEGLSILLQKWDAKRNIKRDTLHQGGEIYQKLSLQSKEALFSQIAFTTFERGDYFFKQQAVEQYIADFILSLPGFDVAPESIDGEAILKAIEAQHGLLVERARGIYSFSHLTFQEYFTAKKIANSIADSFATQAVMLQNLVNHITEKRWRDVFLLTVGMLQNADDLLLSMKAKTDSLLSSDAKLQQFLVWLNEKANSVTTSYKPVTVRAYYSFLILDSASARCISGITANDIPSKIARAIYFSSNINSAIAQNLSSKIVDVIASVSNVITAIAITIDIAGAISSDITSFNDTDAISRAVTSIIDRAIALSLAPKLKQSLQDLKNQLPNPKDQLTFKQWWKDDGYQWTKQLKNIFIRHRNLDYDWQFSEAQLSILEQYYVANHLLIDCLNSDCYITPSVREEIEATLILPKNCPIL